MTTLKYFGMAEKVFGKYTPANAANDLLTNNVISQTMLAPAPCGSATILVAEVPSMPKVLDLSHIPGPPAPRLHDHTLAVMRDSYGTQRQFIREYGDVYKVKVLGQWRVNVCGSDAMERVLLDRDQMFSSTGGWEMIAGLFSGGLMLQDFSHHHQNRRIMQAAFRATALQDYIGRLQLQLKNCVQEWPRDTSFDFCDAIKSVVLKAGCSVFMGLEPDNDLSAKLNNAFIAEIRATMSVIRKPVPLTPMWHGVRGRTFLRRTLLDLIAKRRVKPGTDFFSQMCIATDEKGAAWDDEEIVDQFNFLMMAAHDTTATALTAMVWALGAHSNWQDTVKAEVDAIDNGPLTLSDLTKMEQTEIVFKEALRLVPPVPFIPRRTLKPFDWHGYHIPAGTNISLNPGPNMLSSELFSDPENFDPERFSANRAEHRVHRFAWVPFGGGAHKCIGMHFAMMQVKLFMIALLKNTTIELVNSEPLEWSRIPIPKPRGGLPIRSRSI